MKLRSPIAFAVLGVVAVVCPIALAHMWFDEKTIHFKGGTVDFGAPPSRYALYDTSYEADGMSVWRPGIEFLASEREDDPRPAPNPTHFFEKAAQFESSGKYKLALRAWRWAWTHGVGDIAITRERIELLETLSRSPNLQGGRALLRATSAYKPQGRIPSPVSVAPALRPFVMYRLADSKSLSDREKARQFLALANAYPWSPLAEPALIGVPRILLTSDRVGVTVADIETSRVALHDLEGRYPHSRFRADVAGWQGRVDFLTHRYLEAINQYRRQFALSPTWRAKSKVLDSVVLCEQAAGNLPAAAATLLELYGSETDVSFKAPYFGLLRNALGHINGKQARAFWDRLRANPKLLAFYLDYRLDMTDPTPDLLVLSTHGLDNVLHSRYAGHIMARIAQAAFVLKRTSAAKQYASRSLSKGSSNLDRALDTFLLASVAKREGRMQEARSGYESIVSRYPHSYLVGGAQENLAIIYEHEDRFGDALDVYQKLGYQYDVAYLLDIRMSPEEIAAYVEAHPRSKQIDLLRFSLGIRYLRDDKFRLAATELAKVPIRRREHFRKVLYPGEEKSTDVDPELIPDPLETARDLAHLYRLHRLARSLEAKALTLTRVADYYYDNRNLLLYNPALWHHMREVGIGDYWDTTVATNKDAKVLEAYHWKHECYARTLTLCRKILKEYPHASVRYRVAYRAGCAAERLARMNPYWRWQDSRRDLTGQAINLMSFAKHSPNKDLAAAARKYSQVFFVSQFEARQAFQDAEKYRHEAYHLPRRSSAWSFF